MITSDYLATGGDGYKALLNKESQTKGEDATSMLESYFKLLSPVAPVDEGRTTDISRMNLVAKDDCSSSGSTMITTNAFVQILLVITSIVTYLS